MQRDAVLVIALAVFAVVWCGLLRFARRGPPPPTSLALDVHVAAAPAPDCVVCLDVVVPGDHITVLACGHVYHADCIAKWAAVSPECPLCKAAI
jgi:hypothetical protein